MAIAVELRFPNATLDQYDQMLQKIGMQANGTGPPGLIFHWVAQDGDAFYAVDVWESREVFEAYAQEHIGPIAREVGIEGQPEMRFYDVHNTLSAAG
jgi:hypothetical protein